MKIQTVPFPATPELTVEKCDELRPFIDKCYEVQGRGDSEKELPSKALTIFWWQAMVDFIELLDDDGKRVGLLMSNLCISEATGERYATLVTAYIEPEYRQQGYFKQMLNYMKTVYQARNVKRIDVNVALGIDFCMGTPVQMVYRTEL